MSPVRELMKTGDGWAPVHGGRIGNGDLEPPEEFILGETKPTAANTGLNVAGIAPGFLKIVSGNVTYSTNNATYERLRFTGKVSITGKNITFRDCWFNCAQFGNALVQCTNANVENVTFENCLFRPPTPGTEGQANVTNYGACLVGDRFTMIRCDLSWTCDGIDFYTFAGGTVRDITMLGSYIHDLSYFSPYPIPGGGSFADNQTHNDCMQIVEATNGLHVEGCSFEAMFDPAVGNASEPPQFSGSDLVRGNKYYPSMQGMSVLMCGGDDPVSNMVIHKNWMYGGSVYINWSTQTVGSGTLQITDNRWLRGQRLGDDYTLLMSSSEYNKMTVTGNYYFDTNQQWNGRKNA